MGQKGALIKKIQSSLKLWFLADTIHESDNHLEAEPRRTLSGGAFAPKDSQVSGWPLALKGGQSLSLNPRIESIN